jgi:glycosyltransferase involved in cell wall biosynthesis
MKPEVTLITNYAPDKQESMLRFAEMMRTILSERGFAVDVIRPADRVGRLRRFFPWCGKWLGYVDKYVIFPLELQKHTRHRSRMGRHVYHITDHSNAVYSFVLRGMARVVTCHDVLAIRSARGEIKQNPTGATGRVLQRAILAGLKDMPRLVCVSRNTEQELRRLIGPDGGVITAVLQPLNYEFHAIPKAEAIEAIRVLGGDVLRAVEQGCILHVGGNQWYKNRIGVCRIYAELARTRRAAGKEVPPLILAGKEPDETLARFVNEEKTLPIYFVTSPGNEQVRALYSLARVFLFPSLQEGFGWPIVEALACKCPVVTTGRAPMSEAGGECGFYIDPSNLRAAAEKMDEVLQMSGDQRNAWAEKLSPHLQLFSHGALAEHYENAYAQVLAGPVA